MVGHSISEQSIKTPSRFWRVLFWVTQIHFLTFGFAAAVLVEHVGTESLREFDTQNGWFSGFIYWVFWNTPMIWCALLAGNLPVLLFCWRRNRRLPYSRGAAQTYLFCDLAISAVHIGATLSITPNRSRFFWLGGIVYISIVSLVVTWDVLAILPAMLILARIISIGWPARGKGLCECCEYDLTGNLSGICPECGMPVELRLNQKICSAVGS